MTVPLRIIQQAAGSATAPEGISTAAITTSDRSWLVALAGWNADAPGTSVAVPALSVTDSAGNLWQQAAISSAAGSVRCAAWVAPAALPVTWVSAGLTGNAASLAWTVAELTGLPQAAEVDFSVSASGSGSAASLGWTASADGIGVALLAAGDASAPLGSAPAGWTAAGTAAAGSAATGTTVWSWVNPGISAGSSVTAAALGTTASWAYAVCSLQAAASPPPQQSQAWPLVQVEAAFGAQPGSPSAGTDYLFSGADHIRWTDITQRAIGPAVQARIRCSRGRQYQLQQQETGTCQVSLSNVDGAFTPTNPGSPYYSTALNENMSFQSGTAPWQPSGSGSAAIAWRAGAQVSPSGKVTSFTITVPATVQAGDYVLVIASLLDTGSGAADVVTASSTGTVPAALGPTQYATGSNFTLARVFGFTAASGDAGAVITITSQSGTSYYAGAAIGAYSGAAGVDVYATPAAGSSVPLASPTAVTTADGDWGVCLIATASDSSTSFTSVPYATVREIAGTDAAAICDSDGSAGAAGSTVGAGNWDWSAAGYAAAAFTVALHPAAGGRAVLASSQAYAYASGLNAVAVSSLQVTPPGAASSPGAVSELVTVSPNYRYTASAWFLCPSGWAAGAVAGADWYESDGTTLISSSSSAPVPLAASVTGWVQAAGTFTPPGSAAYARLSVSLAGTPASSDVFYVAEAALAAGAAGVRTGLVAPLTPVRVTAWWQGRQYPVWQGFAQKWPQEWPQLPQWGFAGLRAADALGVAAAGQLQSALIGEILADSPYAYLPCNEEYTSLINGATPSNPFVFSGGYFAPADANGLPAVNRADGNEITGTYLDGGSGQQVSTGLAMNFLGDSGTGMGATGYSAAQTGGRGPSMLYADPGLAAGTTTGTIEFWFTWNGSGSDKAVLLTVYSTPPSAYLGGGAILTVYATATELVAVSGAGTASVALTPSGAPQQAVLVLTGLSDVIYAPFLLYLNGQFGASPGGAVLPFVNPSAIVLGPGRYSYDGGSGLYYDYNVALGHLAVFPYRLPDSRIAAHYEAGAAGWAGVGAVTRFTQLLTWGRLAGKRGGWSAATAAGTPEMTQAAAAYSLSGQSASAAIYSLSQAEGGRYGTQANGTLRYLERAAGYNLPVSAVLADGTAPAPAVLNADPGFTSGAAGWTASGGAAAYDSAHRYGTAGALAVTPSAGSTATVTSPSFTYAGGTATAVFWVNVPAGGTVTCSVLTAAGTAAAALPVSPGAWELAEVAVAPQSASSASLSASAGTAPFYLAWAAMSDAPAGVPYLPKSAYGFDTTYIYNEVTATQQNGPNQLAVYDARGTASEAAYFRRSALSFTPGVVSPYDVSDLTTWSLAGYQQPELHVSAVTVDAAGNPLQAFPVVLALDTGQVAQVTRSPVGGAPITETATVERVAHDIGPGYWHAAYQLSPYGPAQAVLAADTAGFDAPGTAPSLIIAW